MAQIAAADRPRERLDRFGPTSLTDAELVALVIRSGTQGDSALAVASELLAQFGGLPGLAGTPSSKLTAQRALGPAKIASLVAAFELGKRVRAAKQPPPGVVRGPADIAALACRSFVDPTREEVVVLILNRNLRPLRVEKLTRGTDERCLLEPRDVLSMVLQHGGAAFAVAHSHPSGDPTPSAEDMAATDQLEVAAAAVGVRFLNHLVVAGGRWAAADGSGRNSCSRGS